jgi:hypothetical protein
MPTPKTTLRRLSSRCLSGTDSEQELPNFLGQMFNMLNMECLQIVHMAQLPTGWQFEDFVAFKRADSSWDNLAPCGTSANFPTCL